MSVNIWKPMEFAPKDGRTVLLKFGEGNFNTAYWEDEEGWFIGYTWNGKPLYIYDALGWLGIPK